MSNSIRIFNCARCYTQVKICSKCDRGNIYCASKCAGDARKESMKNAGKRYQTTQKGKMAHALRQKRYITRKLNKEKMTHHGSFEDCPDVLLVPEAKDTESERIEDVVIAESTLHYCAFCHITASDSLRFVFLVENYSSKTRATSNNTRGP